MKKKTIIGLIITGVIVIFAVAILFDCFYIVAENEFACVFRFSKMIDITDEAGLHFKAPFVDEVRSFPDTVMLYNVPQSEVLTADQKSMTVDSYLIWRITDPLLFYQTLGTISEAETRLDALTYNSLKNLMGTLKQDDIINEEAVTARKDIYAGITTDVAKNAAVYGISVIDVKIKRFDLPEANEQAVYERMISDRERIAAEYTANGEYQASLIKNEVDKKVNIIISDAEAEAAKIEAEGEAEYMRILAEAYDTEDKRDFYEFIKALEALEASLTGNEKTVVLGPDSALGRILINSVGK
ncbi:MAG: protease modulator HflC [Clostridiales bacterium]|nr:protease modulator HflC [Clostridiales bacterium]